MGIFKHGPSDYPSFLLWLLDETHVTVTAATALVILCTRSAHSVYFGLGAVGSTLIARGIKRTIRQPRPPPPSESKPSPVRPKKTYGMPSTHSTAIAFYFVYLWPLCPVVLNAWVERAALSLVGGMTLWSRIELGYHTVPQVVAGSTVGAVSALVWSALWSAYPAIQPALQNTIDNCVGLVL